MKRKTLLLFACIAIIGSATAQPIAKYVFDGNANDITGNGHNGVVYGATPSTNRFNQAGGYSFDGVNDYISVSNFPALGAYFTVFAWVKVNTLPANRSEILSLGSTATAQGLYIYAKGSNIYTDVSGIYGPVATGKLVANQWIHIAVTNLPNALILFVNGVKAAELNGIIPKISAGRLEFGRAIYNNQNYFKGIIDEATLIVGTMTAAQIMAAYTSEPVITGPSIVDCQYPSNGTYKVQNPAAGSVYNWTLNGSPLPGTGSQITVDFNKDGNNIVTVTDQSDGWRTNFPVLVNLIPSPRVNGPISVLSGQRGVTYSTAAVPGHSYSWVIYPNIGTVVAGNGTNSITVNFNANSGNNPLIGTVLVTENELACHSSNSLSVEVRPARLSAMRPTEIQSESAELTKMKIVPAGLHKYKVLVPGSATINVMDITGRVVQSLKVNRSALLDLSSRSSGVYIIQNITSKEKSIRLLR